MVTEFNSSLGGMVTEIKQPPSPISAAIDRLAGDISSLREAATELSKRLSSVLRKIEPMDKKAEPNPVSTSGSDLKGMIDDAAFGVNDIRKIVVDLLDRLEL